MTVQNVKLANLPQPAPARDVARGEFLGASGWGTAVEHPLKGDASFRRYIRVSQGRSTAMLMDAPPQKEDVRPYITVARFLHQQGYSAPEILAADESAGFVLSEDMGDDLFTRMLAGIHRAEEELPFYEAAVEVLASWRQSFATRRRDGHLLIALPDYDLQEMMREVAIFSDWYLPQVLPESRCEALKQDYLSCWRETLQQADLPCEQLVHRDYHADNLIWLANREGNRRVGLLDFQDALWGCAAYDLVSLLEDARRDVPEAVASRAKARYLALAGCDETEFNAQYALLGAQRNCKIIGIFVRLSRRDGKHGYLSFLPRVWRYLEHDLSHPALAPVKKWMDTHIVPEMRGELSPHGKS